jgi:enolase
MVIKSAQIKKILNSEGAYTIQTTLNSNNHTASASVPKGKSAGQYEAYNVKPDIAIENFNKIKDQLLKKDFDTSKAFDKHILHLDGTNNKSNLGANLILSLSIAFLKLISAETGLEPYEYVSTKYEEKMNIPEFFLLIFEGGKHGSKNITAQEYMLVEGDIDEAQSIIRSYKRYLEDNGLFVGYGLEGAFTSAKLSDLDVLNLMRRLTPHKKIAIDVAESSRAGESLDFANIIEEYNIYSIEDPKHEKDYKGWSQFYKEHSGKIITIGDDLTTTNKTLIKNAFDQKMCNGVIIKPNQIGSVLETIEAVKLAREYGWKVVVSHRGSDTNDDFIADLAVGVGADYVKFGGLQRGERIAKYNRILQIKQNLKLNQTKVASIA